MGTTQLGRVLAQLQLQMLGSARDTLLLTPGVTRAPRPSPADVTPGKGHQVCPCWAQGTVLSTALSRHCHPQGQHIGPCAQPHPQCQRAAGLALAGLPALLSPPRSHRGRGRAGALRLPLASRQCGSLPNPQACTVGD